MEEWPAPRPLIQLNGDHLVVDDETARLLTEVHVPVVVVAIAGIYRTGKSYLMNRLANKLSGFPLGDTLQSKTKGIWAWCLPHSQLSGHALLLLDTEGLGDPEKASEQDDIKILCLAVLLSSFFIYNSIGKIDQEMLIRLYFLSQVLDSISVKDKKPEESVITNLHELQRFLPDFALVVRDFSLELEIDSKSVTADEYFSRVLKLKERPPEETSKYNRPREAILHAFRSHRCFCLPRPVEDDELFCKLETLRENELSQLFLQQSNAFSQSVYSSATAKKVNNVDEQIINGKVWVTLAREYVSAINNNVVPSIEATFTRVTDKTNREAVEGGDKMYTEEMTKLVFPLSAAEVQSAHERATNDARARFQQKALADTENKYLDSLKSLLSERFVSYNTQNEQTSRTKCRQVLDGLYHSTVTPMMNTSTSSHNGAQLYEESLVAIRNNYGATLNKGCMDEIVLQEFMNERNGERTTIQQAVEQLIQRKKGRQELQRQREAAELAARMEQLRLEEEGRKADELKRQQEEERRRLEESHRRKMEEQRMKMEAESKRRLQIEVDMANFQREIKRCPHLMRHPGLIPGFIESHRALLEDTYPM